MLPTRHIFLASSWHRYGIVLASWHRFWHRLWHRLWHCFWHRLGIVLASLQPATKSVNNKKATSDNRSHQPAIKAARTNDDNQLFIDGKENGVPMVTAYIKPINQTEWKIQPLPLRQTTHDTLHKVSYPHVNSCKAFTSQFPIDNPPVDLDPFLPWIHDVFPSSNGKYVMFVAQNRRRCYNGQKMFKTTDVIPEGVVAHKGYVHVDQGKNYYMRPQAALFQHVPVK